MRNLWEELYSSGNDDAFMKCPYGIVTNIIKQYVQENNHKNVRDMNILELGCGSGANLYYAASIGMNVYGIDISPTAIEHAKKEFNSKNFIGGGKFRVSTFAPLEYDKDFFDIVIDRGGLVCADRNLLTNAIDEICRVIKKDGMVLFTPNSELRINVINIYNDDDLCLRTKSYKNKDIQVNTINLNEFFRILNNRFKILSLSRNDTYDYNLSNDGDYIENITITNSMYSIITKYK